MGVGARGPRSSRRPPAIAAVLCGLLAASACTKPPATTEKETLPTAGPTVTPTAAAPQVLRLAVSAPASLDPRDLDTPDSLLVASQVFDGLTTHDPQTLDVVPAVAERWDVLDEGRRIVFHLRPGVTFHDGSPVTAASFVTAWNRLADPVAAKPYAFLLESVDGFLKYQQDLRLAGLTGVVAADELTLDVTLNRPWPDFVSLVGHPALSPVPTIVDDLTFGAQPPGNGPYRVAAPVTPGAPIGLEAHSGYYGIPPAVPRVEFHTFATSQEAWPTFLREDLDIAEIPAPLLAQARSRFGEQGVLPLARMLYCGVNQANERFADPAFRTAVSQAIDREELAEEIYAGLPVPASGIVPPSLPGGGEGACGERCTHQPERAAAVFRGIPKKERTIAMDYAASDVGDRLATELVRQLGASGLTVTPRAHEEGAFEELLEAGQQELFCLVWVADYPRQQAMLEPLLASTSPDNHARVADEGLDAALEEARLQLDVSARQRAYAQIEQTALQAMHVIPVLWFRAHLAVQPYVQGFQLDPLARYDASTLSIAPGASAQPGA